jgi:hypothetical protein
MPVHAAGWTAEVRFPAKAKIFLNSTVSRPALRPTQFPVQWVPKVFSPGGKAEEL